MDTQSLKAFVTVADLNSFSQAAEKLHLTQPAITKRIQGLENHLDTRLFDRIGRQLFLTEAGQCLLPNARRILQLMESSRQALDDLSGPVRGKLRLVTSHHIGLHRLPVVLKDYKHQFSGVSVNIRYMNSRETHEAILAGEADLGVTTREIVPDDSLTLHEIWHDRLLFVAAVDHPLAKAKQITLAQLCDYPALLPDKRFYTGRIVREFFEQHGLTLQLDEGLSTDYMETLRVLVAIGGTWTVLPHTMIDSPELRVLDVMDNPLTRSLICMHHRDLTLSRAAQAFLRVLKAHRDLP
jgi:DNA-binding transcriptional LysR family regulator